MNASLSQLTLEIHIALFAIILLFVAFIGLVIGRKQVHDKNKRILELERRFDCLDIVIGTL